MIEWLQVMLDKILDKLGDNWSLYLGLPAQFAFMSRFVVQWIASERRGKSVVPLAFWYLSLIGSLALLTYFLFGRQDPVGVLGQSLACPIYIRNLVLIYKRKRKRKGRMLLKEMADSVPAGDAE